MAGHDLPTLLETNRGDLVLYVRKRAGRLLRYETVEDLVQAICVRVLERGDDFEYRGREPFFAWLYKVARSLLADRHAHWSALKRRPAALLRLTFGATPDPGGGAVGTPASEATGPATFADRRDQLAQAVKALAVLLPRDRQLVRWSSDGVSIDDQAARLGISYEAAERARLRAIERFRKVYFLASGGAGPGAG